MTRTETRVIPATTRDVIVERTCDLCGKKQRNPDSDWSTEAFDVKDVTIEFNSGTAYPDSNSGTRMSVDMCPDCFKGKLVPWLESKGAQITVHDWES